MQNNLMLKDVATVVTGYAFRSALPTGSFGKIPVIQAKNITPGSIISRDTDLVRVQYAGKSANAIVLDGDVLLTARGTTNGGFKAALVSMPLPATIAASSIYILRPKDNRLASAYLALYLNSDAGQETLRRISVGSNIKTLLLKSLEDMEIALPLFETQEALVSVYENISSQTKLLNKRRSLLHDVLAATIKYSARESYGK